MPEPSLNPCVNLPNNWPRSVQAAILHVISLAQFAVGCARSLAAGTPAAKRDQLEQEIALLREEIRIKDARFGRIPAARRPQYEPCERLAILELRAARGWSLARTAQAFLVATATIASWTQRLDEEGPEALLQTRVPVNKFPDFVRYVVQRLQTLCPRLGKEKIAQILARAGLHLAASTVGRMRREKPASPTKPERPKPMPSANRVTAKHPNHVWHVDLTTVPILGGNWASWLPHALPPVWPFCWWLAIVLDHYSRRVMGVTVFLKQPTAEQIKQFMGRVIAKAGQAPKHLISDRGVQFVSKAFRDWCRGRGIRQRFGAVGQSGSIAVIERFIKTLKYEGLRLLPIVPMVRRAFLREVNLFASWYNGERPHTTLKGAIPNEIYFRQRPANRQPRFEPRSAWPRGSPCAAPQTLVKGQPGVRLELSVAFVSHRRHLPRIRLIRAA